MRPSAHVPSLVGSLLAGAGGAGAVLIVVVVAVVAAAHVRSVSLAQTLAATPTLVAVPPTRLSFPQGAVRPRSLPRRTPARVDDCINQFAER